MLKAAILVLAIAVLSAGVVSKRLSSIQGQRELEALEKSPDYNKLSWHAKRAKLKGEKQVRLPPPAIDYPGSGSDLNAALSGFSVAIVQPVASATAAINDYTVTTWYKVKVLEYLSKKDPPCLTCPTLEQVPQSLLPLGQDEVVLDMVGGSVLIDGVNVSMAANHPPLRKSNKYLLLLATTSSGTALVGAGPEGAFLVDDDNSLKPVGGGSHHLQWDMISNFGPDVNMLRRRLNASH